MVFKSFSLDKTLLKGGMWLAAERLFLLGKGLILAYFFTNLLSKEAYGSYQFILSLLGILAVGAIPGMGTAIVQAIARGKEGTFNFAVKKVIVAAFSGSIVLIIAAIYYYISQHNELALAFLLLSAIFPIYSVANFWRYYYTGKAQFDLLVRKSVVLEIISLVTTLVAILYFPYLVWLVILSIIFPMPFSLLLVWSLYKKTRNFDSDEDNIRFGKRISYTVALSTLATYGDKLLLGHFLGFSELAVYSVAMIIPEQAKGAIGSFMTPLFPRYSKEGANNGKLRKHLILFCVVSLACAIVLYFMLPSLFEIVFSPYVDSVHYARVLLLTLLFIPFVLLETFFRSQKKEQIVFRANLVGSVIGIILAFVMVPLFGISGAIFAKLSGQFVQGISYMLSHFYPEKHKT